MENNSQSRTLYLIQMITIIVLILLLIVQVLPLFGIAPPGKEPHIQMYPKSNTAPVQRQSQTSIYDIPALSIPALILE